jgi:hypothetical protein
MKKAIFQLMIFGGMSFLLSPAIYSATSPMKSGFVAQYDSSRTRNTVESDRILEGKVKEKLSRKGLSQKFDNIEVVVKDGIVTLFGDVKSAQDRLEAEKRANEVTKHIVNNIQVIDVEETKELKPESKPEPEL